MRTECPKCASKKAWIERTETDVVLRCLCGVYRILATKIKEMEIHHNDCDDDVKLPRRETFLWSTVMVVAVMEGSNSAEITERLVDLGHLFSVSDVSSYLTILRSKGLVRTIASRRGIVGGSTWELTEICKKLLGNGNGS